MLLKRRRMVSNGPDDLDEALDLLVGVLAKAELTVLVRPQRRSLPVVVAVQEAVHLLHRTRGARGVRGVPRRKRVSRLVRLGGT